MKYEATEQVELPTIYLGDKSDPRRIRIVFPDSATGDAIPTPVMEALQDLMPGLPEMPKEPALLEIFGINQHAEISVDSPEQLEEIAKGIQTAALEWRHCIKECECYDEEHVEQEGSEEETEIGEATIVSVPLADIFGGMPSESSEPRSEASEE